MYATRISLAVIFLMLATGCRENAGSTPELKAVKATALVRNGPIVFQSWGGHWQGSDLDTELTINPDGTAELSYYGYAHEQVTGTWSAVDNELILTIPFATLTEMPGAADWPTLQTKTANGKLYLTPTRETDALQYSHGSAWPLGEI